MEATVWVLITFLAAYIGGVIGKRSGIPAGMMIGSIFLVAFFNIMTGRAVVPVLTRPVMQILGGALLGHTLLMKDLLGMKRMYKAVVLMIFWMVGLNLMLGFLISRVSGMDLATALFSAAPGGVADMALIADELNADMSTVSVMQLFRLFSIFLLYPPLFRWVKGRSERVKLDKASLVDDLEMDGLDEIFDQEAAESYAAKDTPSAKHVVLTFMSAIAGGGLFMAVGISAGGMIGSLMASAAYNIYCGKAAMPKIFKSIIQIGVGALIGSRMDSSALNSLTTLALPILILITGLILFTVILGKIMTRVTGMDFITSLLAVTPGGLQEMSMMAHDLGCETPSVLLMHTVRLICVICVFPIILAFVAGV